MTTLFSERRRANELAAALDDPHRDVDAELRTLVELAGSVTALVASTPAATPRPDFAADLRSRLMTEADQVLLPGAPLVLAPRTGVRRERRLVAAASVLVVVGGGAGMAAAAQGALPGDPLYSVKRGIERAEAGLSMSSAGRGRDLLHQADGRLVEVQGLLADDRLTSTTRVPAALDDFVSQAEEGADLLLGAFVETRDASLIEDLRVFTSDSVTDLQDIAEEAPRSTRPALSDAAAAVRDIDVAASDQCITCAAGLPTLELPGLLLAAAEADRALSEVDVAGLDNSHPFVVPKSLVSRSGRPGSGAADGQGGPGGGSGGGRRRDQ